MAHANFHAVEADDPIECGARLGRMFGPIMRDYVEEARESSNWSILKREARGLLDATSRSFPDYVSELEAYATAAGLPLLDVWTVSVEDEIGGEGEHCTTLVTNNGRLLAHNEDWDEDSADHICVLEKNVGGIRSLQLYYYGSPLGATALHVSGHGHVQAINSLDHEDWQVGVPKIVIARRLADAANLGLELDEVLGVPRSSGYAHTFVERCGRVTAVECSAVRQSIRSPSLPFVHTNHIIEAALATAAGGCASKSSQQRLRAASAGARSDMSAVELEMLLASGMGRGEASLCNRNTIARSIIDFERSTARIWLKREPKRGWVDYPIGFATSVLGT